MQIINEEDNVKFRELIKEIYKFAKQHNEPFTSSEAFEHVKEADDVAAVSNAVRTLYIEGKMARKKIDGFRYSYALIENAPEGYETADGTKPAAAETKSDTAEPKPIVTTLSIGETKPPISEAPARKYETESKEAAKNRQQDKQPLQAQLRQIEIPENFVLSLQTPGGLVITIKTGIL